jgi:hypothetical protein
MQRVYYRHDRRSLYRETTPASSPDAFLWPFSRAVQGTLTVAGLPAALRARSFDADVADRLHGLKRYWNGRARNPAYDSAVRPWFGRGGDRYYDDNAWLALALVQAYRQGLLDRLDIPALLFDFGRSGWDTRREVPAPGGVFWVEQGVGLGLTNHDRGAGTSGGTAMLGFQLAELEERAGHSAESVAERRSVAGQMLHWVQEALDSSGGRGHGPFWNAVLTDGRVDRNLWSYNQGVVIGALVLAFRASGDRRLLEQAEAIARQTLATFGGFANHPPAFNAMCLQYLLVLSASSGDQSLHAEILDAFASYADWSWDPANGAHDPESNLFSFDDGGQPAHHRRNPLLQDQGALVQLYGLLAWDPSDYLLLA